MIVVELRQYRCGQGAAGVRRRVGRGEHSRHVAPGARRSQQEPQGHHQHLLKFIHQFDDQQIQS